MMGRILLFAGAVLLLATAFIHAGGQSMVDGWIQGFDHQRKAAIRLVWMTDSLSWAVVSILWATAGWRRERGWLGAAAIAAVIPLGTAVGIIGIDPNFFGGWMLIGSVALAAVGILLSLRKA